MIFRNSAGAKKKHDDASDAVALTDDGKQSRRNNIISGNCAPMILVAALALGMILGAFASNKPCICDSVVRKEQLRVETPVTSGSHMEGHSQPDQLEHTKSQPLISDWPPLARRMDVIPLLEKMKFSRAIEVGVQKGILAKKSLDLWPSNVEYNLVDLWGNENNYQEPNKRDINQHNGYLRETRRRMEKWKDKNNVHFYIMRSTDAAPKFKDGVYDYIYLDARHDYCAVKEELGLYYPKLRPGGVIGGHDYVDAQYAVSCFFVSLLGLRPLSDCRTCDFLCSSNHML